MLARQLVVQARILPRKPLLPLLGLIKVVSGTNDDIVIDIDPIEEVSCLG